MREFASKKVNIFNHIQRKKSEGVKKYKIDWKQETNKQTNREFKDRKSH